MLDTAFLRQIDFFQALPDEVLERLRALAVGVRLRPGQILFVEGEACRGMYLVCQGRVRIFKTSPEGREQVLMVARAGHSFAEVPVFDGGPNPASAAAMDESIVYLFPAADLVAMVTSTPEFGLSVIRVMARRLRQLTRLVEDLSFRHVTARVAKLLLQGSQQLAADQPQRLTQHEMAAMIGTSREVVTRALRQLEHQGAIQVERGRIVVLKPELLEQMIT